MENFLDSVQSEDDGQGVDDQWMLALLAGVAMLAAVAFCFVSRHTVQAVIYDVYNINNNNLPQDPGEQIADVVALMKVNLDRIADRDEKLADLMLRAEELEESCTVFQEVSTIAKDKVIPEAALKRAKDRRRKIVLIIVLGVVVFSILVWAGTDPKLWSEMAAMEDKAKAKMHKIKADLEAKVKAKMDKVSDKVNGLKNKVKSKVNQVKDFKNKIKDKVEDTVKDLGSKVNDLGSTTSSTNASSSISSNTTATSTLG
ncbi:hypothetical protein CAPTEDRAFT_191460 [Capitella teleta]|uniref:V-SNARE coiled-coil homology domain-containing protein n=1 Tax=Capitella teleta TaxID=283909 RepID=R7T940_CAPTE|nr:hypothetical protein CAPTEDRAFT_191460 [Capitella teleta]|eukprot:ELT90248.1 hypothetical protein CAPTEDRAFT_191460 [Capitella teleta]